MKHITKRIPSLRATITLTAFSAGSVSEIHAMLSIEPNGDTFAQQQQRIIAAEAELMQMPELQGAKPVMKRYFLSDAANQVPEIAEQDTCTVSYIQQPPLEGSKLAVWLYLQTDTDIHTEGNTTVVEHNGYRHIWTMGLCNTEAETSYMQTWNTLINYIDILRQHDATLEQNCVRTWFFVRDVDTQYAGLVKSRRECFNEQGLTTNTHYIASTGIGGTPADARAIVQLGGYALTGFQPEQQRYLYAPTHLNRTSDYGVTFERGTLLQFGDRNHIYISGTASIDNRGEVLHVGDIRLQTRRMWENVEKLLEEGGMTYQDVMQIIVYLRDGADYSVVNAMFRERFPDIPFIITLAPVCRPTWLVEMECIAVKAADNPYPAF